ncbi:MAG: glycerol-3-phosphate dehydrogenase, partial [Rhodobacteraceae bacterium]|nr:glycerol-3-phosphate dehydrogenase [Paracoccaceae bacterium]
MPWMKGRRPAWLIRFGLFLYDNLGGRKILPGTTLVDLTSDPVGKPLQDRFTKAYEYSDCWVEDSRLVVLNARDAAAHGAQIMTRTKVLLAERVNDVWHITTEDQDTKETRLTVARMLVNAGGPWVKDIICNTVHINSSEGVRLVRGSHIVTRKLFEHDKCYFFQGEDGRIIFAIPYETDFTLIGTTDSDHKDASIRPECNDAEADYLRGFASSYFKKPIEKEDIVWSYSGVRPLYDDGASSATAATRDYVLKLDQQDGGAPLLNIFGGKITTYRKLAEHALEKLVPFFTTASANWTAGVSLPGGDFPVDGVATLIRELRQRYVFLDAFWAKRLVRAYGTEASLILGDAKLARDMGKMFAATLTEREIVWLMEKEYARTAEDVVWRRSRLGLRMSKAEIDELDIWMKDMRDDGGPAAAIEPARREAQQ